MIKCPSRVLLVRHYSQRLDNQLVLSWTNASFNLQSAPAMVGPFTNIPAVTSPYTNAFNTSQKFFRLISS